MHKALLLQAAVHVLGGDVQLLRSLFYRHNGKVYVIVIQLFHTVIHVRLCKYTSRKDSVSSFWELFENIAGTMMSTNRAPLGQLPIAQAERGDEIPERHPG